MIPISNFGLKLSISTNLRTIDQLWEFWDFWLKLTHLIDYDVIDRMWEFGVKLSESIDYIVIDRFEVQGEQLHLVTRTKSNPKLKKHESTCLDETNRFVFRFVDPPRGATPETKRIEINRFWFLGQLGIEIDWHRYEDCRCSLMMLMKQETRRISRVR